ncbi:hypothetical protein N9B73_10155 [Verrucomicrobiales bacterium]|nr:hypothetical protein [Verrucomicrobiales bacterium]
MNNSSGLVQGASGVPFKYLNAAGWNLKLHGNYTGPMPTFSGHHQADLAAAYRDCSYPVKPMTFGLGYLLNPKRACVIVGRN